MLTRLELFLRRMNLDPAEFGTLTGYTPQHFRRLRRGESDATRGGVYAVVGVARKLTGQRVTPGLLFERGDPFVQGTGQRLSVMYAADREALDTLLAEDVTPRFPDRLRATGVAGETAVLHLMTAARNRLNTNPVASAIIYEAAASISLPEAPYALAASLGGHALKGCSNALRRLGALDVALGRLLTAMELFVLARYCAEEAGQVEYARATVFFEKEMWDDALPATHSAHAHFIRCGDSRRAVDAEVLEAGILFEQGDTEAAHAKWTRLAKVLASMRDREGLARVWGNLAACEIRLQRPADARRWLKLAAAAFRKLNNLSELARTRWNMGTYVATFEDATRALPIFEGAYRSFLELGMVLEAVYVGLDELDVMIDIGVPEKQKTAHACSVADALGSAGLGAGVPDALDQLREIAHQKDTAAQRRVVQRVRAALRDAKAICSEVSMAVAAFGKAG